MHTEDQMNGHPLRVLRTQLDLSQKEFAANVGVSEVTISRAENGHRLSPKVRRQLCDRLGMTSEALGLLGRKQEVIHPSSTPPRTQGQDRSSSSQIISSVEVSTQPMSLSDIHIQYTPTVNLVRPSKATLSSFTEQQQEEAWLTLGASYLGQLFNDGWSASAILTSAKIVLQGIDGMPSMARQNLLVSDAMRSGSPFLTGRHVSQEELARLHHALDKSIDAGWKLFHTASNAQVLAVGQAPLYSKITHICLLVFVLHIILPYTILLGLHSIFRNTIS